MKPYTLGCAIAVLLAAAPAAFAQEVAEEEPGSPFAWNAALTSEYVWRGVSQSNEGVAFQTGLTYTSPIGVYATVWGSNVDFGAGDPDFEVDGIVGFNTDFSDNVNFDVSVIRYMYPGAGDLDWNELDTKTTFLGSYSLIVNYSNDAWATGESGLYYGVAGSWELPAGLGLAASAGRSDFSSDAGIHDYADWSVSLSKGFGPATASVGYYESDGDFGELGDDRIVLTIAVAAP